MDDDGFSKAELLKLEYEQTSEAFRHQGTLLNRAYYLSAVVFTFLVGAIASVLNQESLLMGIGLSFLGSIAFIFLGSGASAYHRRRETASEYRQTLTDQINNMHSDNVLRLQGNQAAGSEDVSKKPTEYPLNNLYYLLFGIAGIFLLFGVLLTGGLLSHLFIYL